MAIDAVSSSTPKTINADPPPEAPASEPKAPAPRQFADQFEQPPTTSSTAPAKPQADQAKPPSAAPPNAPTFKASQFAFGVPSGVSATVSQAESASAPASGRTPDEQRAAAEKDYDTFFHGDTKGKMEGADLMYGIFASHEDEPDYQATMVALLHRDGSLMNSVANAWETRPNDREVYTKAMGAARDRHMLGDEQIASMADGSWPNATPDQAQAWAELARTLSPPIDVSSPQERQAAVAQVTTAQAGLAAAQQKTHARDEQLENELAGLGPALTPEERSRYTSELHAKYSADYNQEATAADGLSQALANPALRKAVTDDPTNSTARAVFAAYETLADSPNAQEALDFVDRVMGDPGSPESLKLQKALGGGSVEGLKARLDGCIEKATTNTFNRFVLEARGDVGEAFTRFQGFMGAKKALTSLTKLRKGWGGAIDDAVAARNGDYSVLGKLADNWDKMSGLERAMAGVSVINAASGAVTTAQQGDYLKAVKDVVDFSKGGTELIAGATEAMARAGKFSQWIGPASEGATGAGELASKLVPVLSVLSNGLAAASDLRDAVTKKRIGLALAASAEGLAAISSAMGPEAMPVTWAATTTAGIIKFADGIFATKAEQNERYQLLANMGMDPDLARALGYSNDASLKAIAEQMGFTPEMIQDFALRFPDQVTYDISPQYEAAGKFARAFGLAPTELQDMLRFNLGNNANVINFLSLVQTPAALDGVNAADFRSSFEAIANSDLAPDDQRRAARIVLNYLDTRNAGPSGDS